MRGSFERHFFGASFGAHFFNWEGSSLPDYKEMYRKLFIAVTQATEILKEAQIECEELYINSSEDDENKIAEFKIMQKNKEK